MEMSRLDSEETVLRFSSKADKTMVFRLRSDMESCLNWFASEGMLAVRNNCTEPVQIQLFTPKTDKTIGGIVPASEASLTGLKYNEAKGFVFSACPTDTEPTLPFDESGFHLTRKREYECR